MNSIHLHHVLHLIIVLVDAVLLWRIECGLIGGLVLVERVLIFEFGVGNLFKSATVTPEAKDFTHLFLISDACLLHDLFNLKSHFDITSFSFIFITVEKRYNCRLVRCHSECLLNFAALKT